MRHLFAAAALAYPVDAGSGEPVAPRSETLVQSYRQLADVFHEILSEHTLDNLLERIADSLAELVPHDTLSIYQADEAQSVLIPVLARDQWAEKIMNSRSEFGEGITGWAALHREPVRTNQAHLDPRKKVVPGTPDDEPEALITIPLIARGMVKGVLNIYRLGETATFEDEEFELAIRLADAAALALDNAQIRARLEYQAQTDSLTGLYNHRYFHERLRAELTRASRVRDSVSVLMLDIDDFKRVNDVYGHGAGDQVLRDLADLLREALRGSDVVCRLGGGEIGEVIADELRLLIDYHNCRVMVIEGDEVVPIAFRGDLVSSDGEHVDFPRSKVGEGITGRAAATLEPLLVGNTLECEYAVMIPG